MARIPPPTPPRKHGGASKKAKRRTTENAREESSSVRAAHEPRLQRSHERAPMDASPALTPSPSLGERGEQELPAGWKWVKLGDVAKINPKLPMQLKDSSTVQFIPMKLIEEVTGRFHRTETKKYGEVKKGYTAFVDNDILFAKVTPCMENGKIARVHGLLNGVGFGSTEFHVLRPSESIVNDYLTHFILQNRFRHEAEQAMTGAVGLRRVPKQFVENYPIPLPPLATQHAIVAKIEQLFSELDKGVEAIKRAQQQLKTYRQAVLKAAFEGRLVGAQDFVPQQAEQLPQRRPDGESPALTPSPSLGERGEQELPAGWKWVKLGEVLKVSSGKLLRVNNLKDGAYPVYGGNGINGYHSKYLIDKPTLIIGRVGAKCGVTHITKDKSWVTDNALIVEPMIDGFSLEFFKLKLEFENLNKLSSSTAQPVISGAKLYEYEVALPPLAEQHAIVAAIESRLSVAEQLEATLAQSLTQAESLRQAVLKKAFEGRLVDFIRQDFIRQGFKPLPNENG